MIARLFVLSLALFGLAGLLRLDWFVLHLEHASGLAETCTIAAFALLLSVAAVAVLRSD